MLRLAIFLPSCFVVLAGCGGDENADGSGETTAADTTTTAPTTTAPVAGTPRRKPGRRPDPPARGVWNPKALFPPKS